MSDLKKLFRRDRFYWGIVMVVMILAVIYMLTNVYGLYHKLFHLEEYLELSQYLQGFWDTHPELIVPAGVYSDEIPQWFLGQMVSVTVIVTLIAQATKLLVQENQNRAEVLHTFPVKSRNLMIYHYLSGLSMTGLLMLMQIAILRLDILYVERNTNFIFTNKEQLWIYAGKAVIIFMLHYSLLIVCIKVANHVPGTIVTFAVAEFAMDVLVEYRLGLYWSNLAEDSLPNWVFWIFVMVVLILLSYIADQKKDYARNGFYAFSIAHWVVMGTVFGEIYFIFYIACGDMPKAVSVLVALAASVLITTGVHFVSKPEKTSCA
ncbi:MAG: hypothetical protein HDR06_06180 [Lachnospiraceae bacterium]|nr:hypothetical protein [Lachnospiraceae bacterium]